MGYTWNHEGVECAIEETMRSYPELLQRFEVADARDPSDFTWHVDLDPLGDRRIARIGWEMVEYGLIDAIAERIREAAPTW